MAYLLTNLPIDIKNFIDEKVKELHETDYRKATLKTLADEAATHMTCVIGQAMGWYSYDLHFAWQELDLSRYENDHGPSGDSGNYESQTLETSQVEYKAAIDRWNGFIDEFEYLSHLLRGFHADRFYHIDHSDCE